jgi:hypothetical protein
MKRFMDACGRPLYILNIKGTSETPHKSPKILFGKWDRGDSDPGDASLFSSTE